MAGHMDPKLAKSATIVTVISLIILAFSLVFEAQERGKIDWGIPTTVENTVGVYYKVNRVVDGDTLAIEYEGKEEKVRLIGINTPETVDPRQPVQCFGKEASEQMKDLADGKLVRLEFDDTQDRRDAYGRLLAYVYLEDEQMLNRKMIADGYAYEYTYMRPYRFQEEFKQLQTLARTSERGLWAKDSCAGKK